MSGFCGAHTVYGNDLNIVHISAVCVGHTRFMGTT
jgi:hypothetical protein